jgi:preprotein translocase subunit YajC
MIAQSAEGGPNQFVALMPFLLMLVVAYFLIWRPQSQQQKKQQEFIDQLKKGDEVLLTGGLFAKVFEVRPTDVTVELGSNKVKVLKSGITGSAPVAVAAAAKSEAEKKS